MGRQDGHERSERRIGDVLVRLLHLVQEDHRVRPRMQTPALPRPENTPDVTRIDVGRKAEGRVVRQRNRLFFRLETAIVKQPGIIGRDALHRQDRLGGGQPMRVHYVPCGDHSEE